MTDPVVEQTKAALGGDKAALTALIDTPITPEQAKEAMGLPVAEVVDWCDPDPEPDSQTIADRVLVLERHPEAVRAEGVRTPTDLPEHDTPEAPDDEDEEIEGGDDRHRDH